MGRHSSSLDRVVRGRTPQGSSSLPASQPRLTSEHVHPSRPIVAIVTLTPPSGQSVRACKERVRPPKDSLRPAPYKDRGKPPTAGQR